MMDISLNARWETFRKIVLESQHTPAVEMVLLKRAFYTGAYGMLTCVKLAAEHPVAQACDLMDGLEDELKTFQLIVGTPAEL